MANTSAMLASEAARQVGKTGVQAPQLLASGELWFFVIVAVFGSIILFLAIRWFILWYWKIDKATTDLRRIADSMEEISGLMGYMARRLDQGPAVKKSPADSDTTKKTPGKGIESAGSVRP